MSEWISVKEKGLPKLGAWCLVVIDGVVQRMAAHLDENADLNNPDQQAWNWADWSADEAPIKAVTHWMPLPEPPK